MYTAEITNVTHNKESQSVFIDFKFTDGVTTLNQQLRFAHDETMDNIKKRIKGYLRQLESADTNVAAIPVGALDLSTTVIDRTQAEIDFNDWYTKFARMEKVQKLIDLGIVQATNPKVVALKDWLTANIKPAYVDQL